VDFELKLDRFRALAIVNRGRAKLISRNRHRFGSFGNLAREIEEGLLSIGGTARDGEIVLSIRWADPSFLIFSLIVAHHVSSRSICCFGTANICVFQRLIDHKLEFRRLYQRHGLRFLCDRSYGGTKGCMILVS